MEIQVPIKKDALDFVPDLERRKDYYLEQAIRLESPHWGISDDDEILIDKTKARLYREFVNFLDGVIHEMKSPRYEKMGN